MKSSAADFLVAQIGKHRAIAPALREAVEGKTTLRNIAEAAQPFLASVLAHKMKGRVWIVCNDVRHQEDFAAEMAAWCARVRLFPDLEIPAGDALPDAETASERLELLQLFATTKGQEVIVIHEAQWESPVPLKDALRSDVLSLQVEQALPMERVCAALLAAGYEQAPQVSARGQFARRGGILDVFSWQQPRPIRAEWNDQEIETLREFDIDTQASLASQTKTDILLLKTGSPKGRLREYYMASDHIIRIDPAEVVEGLSISSELGDAGLAFDPPPLAELRAGDLVLDEAKRTQFFSQLRTWDREGWHCVLACNNEGEGERFRELAADFDFDASAIQILAVPATRGFICTQAKYAILSDAEMLGRSASQRAHRAAIRRERRNSRRATMDFSEFEEDDFVVHLEHGIGRYLGLQESPDGVGGEVLALEFANDSRLYVPLDQAWQIARYVGVGKGSPELSDLGSGRWSKAKEKAMTGIFDYAGRMLKIQAERESASGFAFPPDSHWQQEFERSFLYTETPDQLRAIGEAKTDMESPRPMDRLICGDVGFGKTEIAIRAVFKATTGGKQAAIIAPTTVLAQQHFQTLRERMSEYPVTIELLSRYRTATEQKRVVKGLADGSVDIVVGTHRIISADVHFKNLGLLVVDEEQRFGVKHKDALKEKFRMVDVLTLSATPIPRTLYLSLMGARDMSLIETPPPNRQAVETIVCGYDERIIRDAITRELARGGQVYFLHNRVQTISRVATRIRELCPHARVIVGHGQMEEHELEGVMETFVAAQADVLVSTTIIESGLDIPNANTIIIDRADRFGLADLYQLRGRVGRSSAKAYAYLMLPRELMAGGAARKRVSAIKQYSELGSGFRIAMRDLEIRGAGNLLGTAQSGHIIAVGFDLYCKMLKRTVESLQGRKPQGAMAQLRLDFLSTNEADFLAIPDRCGAFLPAGYIADSRQRIETYRRIAELAQLAEVESLRKELRDRFGPLPLVVENVLTASCIRLAAGSRRISLVEVRGEKLMITRGGTYVLGGGRFPRLTSPDSDSRLREVLDVIESMPRR